MQSPTDRIVRPAASPSRPSHAKGGRLEHLNVRPARQDFLLEVERGAKAQGEEQPVLVALHLHLAVMKGKRAEVVALRAIDLQLDAFHGKVAAITTVTDDTDLIIFYKSGVINRIKAKNVPIKKRTTSCVKLIETFPKNDQIICVLKVDDFDK